MIKFELSRPLVLECAHSLVPSTTAGAFSVVSPFLDTSSFKSATSSLCPLQIGVKFNMHFPAKSPTAHKKLRAINYPVPLFQVIQVLSYWGVDRLLHRASGELGPSLVGADTS